MRAYNGRMTNTTTAQQIATDALEQATDHGTRTWLRAPRVTQNAFGGTDIRQCEVTYRTAMDDNEVAFYVFHNGDAMLLAEQAHMTASMAAYMLPAYIADALR